MSRPRSAARFGVDSSGSLLGMFPPGEHVFPADAAAIMDLHAALAAALREVRIVSAAQIDAHLEAQREGVDPEAFARQIAPLRHSFELAALRAFVRTRRPAFDAALRATRARLEAGEIAAIAEGVGLAESDIRARLASPAGSIDRADPELSGVARASLGYAVARLERLIALGAPDILVAHERAHALALIDPAWAPFSFDPDTAIPDEIYPATILDREYFAKRGEKSPVLGADVTTLALGALQCCVAPDARALPEAEAEALFADEEAWSELGDPYTVDDNALEVPDGAIAVRPTLSSDVVGRLVFRTDPCGSDRATALVSIAMNEDECEEDGTPIFGLEDR